MTPVGIAAVRTGRRRPRCSRSTCGSPPSTRGWGRSSWSGPRRSGPRRRPWRPARPGRAAPGRGAGGPSRTASTCRDADPQRLGGDQSRPTPTPSRSGACARPGRCWSARPAARAGPVAVHREHGVRGRAEPLEPGARPRRLLGRQRGRGGGGHGPDRPGRRRRLGPHAGLQLRAGRDQARPRGGAPFPADGPSALCGMSEPGPGHHRCRPRADAGRRRDRLPVGRTPGRPLRIGVTAKPGALGVKVDAEVRAAWTAPPGCCGTPATRSSPPTRPRRNGDAGPFLHRFFVGVAEEAAPLDRAALEPRTRAEARAGLALRRARPVPSGPPARVLASLRAWFEDHDVLLSRPWPHPALGRRLRGQGPGQHDPRPHRLHAVHPALRPIGFPAASVPAGTSTEGLPLGVQLAAAPAARRCCCRWPASSRRCAWPRHAPLEPVPASS